MKVSQNAKDQTKKTSKFCQLLFCEFNHSSFCWTIVEFHVACFGNLVLVEF